MFRVKNVHEPNIRFTYGEHFLALYFYYVTNGRCSDNSTVKLMEWQNNSSTVIFLNSSPCENTQISKYSYQQKHVNTKMERDQSSKGTSLQKPSTQAKGHASFILNFKHFTLKHKVRTEG